MYYLLSASARYVLDRKHSKQFFKKTKGSCHETFWSKSFFSLLLRAHTKKREVCCWWEWIIRGDRIGKQSIPLFVSRVRCSTITSSIDTVTRMVLFKMRKKLPHVRCGAKKVSKFGWKFYLTKVCPINFVQPLTFFG